MTMQDENFWRTAAPGMLQLGAGLWGQNAARKEAEGRLNASGMREFDAASRNTLAQVGSMDPKAVAQGRFNDAQGLLAGKDAADEQALLRRLHAQGMLGAGTYNPGVEGITPGSAEMNPQLAAFYAAQNARNARMSFDALREGEQLIDSRVNRAGMLGQQAAQRQAMAQSNRTPSKTAGTMNLLNSGLKFLQQNPNILKEGVGMLGNLFSDSSNAFNAGFNFSGDDYRWGDVF